MSEEISYQMQDNDTAQKKVRPVENVSEMSFRVAMDELNKTVLLLEGNTLELEESLEKYKYGVELLAHLKKSLNNAQLQVEELMGKIEAEVVSDEERDSNIS